MKWYEIKDHRPPHGELIWIWNADAQCKMLMRYLGSEDGWISGKNDPSFPVWAYLNEQETQEGSSEIQCCSKCWNEEVACVCMSEDDECQ
jgi:hypothetical protein